MFSAKAGDQVQGDNDTVANKQDKTQLLLSSFI